MQNTVEIKSLKKLEHKLKGKSLQKLLYLELLHSTIQKRHQEKSHLKHATAILRMIQSDKLPQVILRPKSPQQIVDFLQILWEKAWENQASQHLKEKATTFTELGMHLEKAFEKEDDLMHLFEAAFQFGKEYCCFCLEQI